MEGRGVGWLRRKRVSCAPVESRKKKQALTVIWSEDMRMSVDGCFGVGREIPRV
jgi:hypothetical protein